MDLSYTYKDTDRERERFERKQCGLEREREITFGGEHNIERERDRS